MVDVPTFQKRIKVQLQPNVERLVCDVIGRSLTGSIGASVVPHTYRPRSVANWAVAFPIGPVYPPRQAPNSCERHNVSLLGLPKAK